MNPLMIWASQSTMIGIMTVRDPLKNCGKETAFISHLLEVQLFIMLYMYNCMYIHELPVIINFYLLVFTNLLVKSN